MLPMFTRRAALISAAATALMLATPALAADDLKLPRQKVELVASPFVHAQGKATKTGVFVYHCAPGGPMITWHVVSGMNGAVMVLPRDGLNDGKGHALKYDKVYYIGEQDMYVPRDDKGNFKSYESPGEAFTDT